MCLMVLPTSDQAPLRDVATVADCCLIASHRLAEWVSNAPSMEEDVAIGNIALDLLGQARGLLSHLGDEDQLAYFRDAVSFRNPVICELPNGDFAHTMLRQLFLDVWLEQVWRAFAASDDEVVRGVAEKAIKENAYHRRHSSSWVVRLGDGTDESHRRMLAALDELWPYCWEIAVDGWYDEVVFVLNTATLPTPAPPHADPQQAPRVDHTVHLTELLAEMQSLARAHPGASW
ncbi:MAG TPA: 1,2-phenylacetyl-CoA epoxidase subunit PaaC [Mycobacteriales bacterium]|jgi:ring-1,2-phenylacetyl-CoA epoxidase subunit PaaC|nr:1,2-phenylacetyl-CoA epoxidase subunit PaaC [Mycobacteriales bacterium]